MQEDLDGERRCASCHEGICHVPSTCDLSPARFLLWNMFEAVRHFTAAWGPSWLHTIPILKFSILHGKLHLHRSRYVRYSSRFSSASNAVEQQLGFQFRATTKQVIRILHCACVRCITWLFPSMMLGLGFHENFVRFSADCRV